MKAFGNFNFVKLRAMLMSGLEQIAPLKHKKKFLKFIKSFIFCFLEQGTKQVLFVLFPSVKYNFLMWFDSALSPFCESVFF